MAVASFSYQSGNSPLHRLSPLIKFLGLIIASAVSFIAFPWGFASSAAIVFSAALIAHIRMAELFHGCTGLVFLSALTVLSHSFPSLIWNTEGFINGLTFGMGLLVSFAGAKLFFTTTTMAQLKDTLDYVPLTWFKRFSLCLTLMLGFLPRFLEKWEAAELAYKARAGKNGIRKLFTITPLVVELMIEAAVETAVVLEMRGWE